MMTIFEIPVPVWRIICFLCVVWRLCVLIIDNERNKEAIAKMQAEIAALKDESKGAKP